MIQANIAEDIFKDLEKLPTLPGIAMKILELVKGESTSLKEIGNVLSSDPALSAQILKLINSPFYGVREQVTSIPLAVNLLGLNTVKNLALSFSLLKNYPKGNKENFDYTFFWKQSVIGAVSSKFIALRVMPKLSEDAFCLGLIQNIGILALIQCMPQQYSLVLKERARIHCSYHEAENQILGFSHVEAGEYLIRTWGLPEFFFIPILYHHNPEQLKTRNPKIELLTKVLHLSSLFINLNTSPNKKLYLAMLDFYIKEYGFTRELKIDEITRQIHDQTMEIFPLFDIKIGEEKAYLAMIDSAREELINLSTDVMQDLLEQQREIESLRQQTIRDGLTNLFNFQRFHESLEQEVNRAKRYKLKLSVIFADIDFFKAVNDQHGHLAGDYCLKRIAQCLKDSLREPDSAARYGGEEFAFILPETGQDNALLVAQRLRKNVESTKIDYEGEIIPVTMSFGVVTLDIKHDISKNELIKKADTALYHAKKTGRNKCCVYESTMS